MPTEAAVGLTATEARVDGGVDSIVDTEPEMLFTTKIVPLVPSYATLSGPTPTVTFATT
jgi:hypothetical protein